MVGANPPTPAGQFLLPQPSQRKECVAATFDVNRAWVQLDVDRKEGGVFICARLEVSIT
jgi:hypothetical protein